LFLEHGTGAWTINRSENQQPSAVFRVCHLAFASRTWPFSYLLYLQLAAGVYAYDRGNPLLSLHSINPNPQVEVPLLFH
jgi:hypothetical protein